MSGDTKKIKRKMVGGSAGVSIPSSSDEEEEEEEEEDDSSSPRKKSKKTVNGNVAGSASSSSAMIDGGDEDDEDDEDDDKLNWCSKKEATKPDLIRRGITQKKFWDNAVLNLKLIESKVKSSSKKSSNIKNLRNEAIENNAVALAYHNAGYNGNLGAGANKYDVVNPGEILKPETVLEKLKHRISKAEYDYEVVGETSSSKNSAHKPLFALSTGLPAYLKSPSVSGLLWAREMTKKQDRKRYLMVPKSELKAYESALANQLKPPMGIQLVGWSTTPETYGFAASRQACITFAKKYHDKACAVVMVDGGVIDDQAHSDAYDSDGSFEGEIKKTSSPRKIAYAVGHGAGKTVRDHNSELWKCELAWIQTPSGTHSLPMQTPGTNRPALEQCVVIGVDWTYEEWAMTSSEDVALTSRILGVGDIESRRPKRLIHKLNMGESTETTYSSAYLKSVASFAEHEKDMLIAYAAYGSVSEGKARVVYITLGDLASCLAEWNGLEKENSVILQSRIFEKIAMKSAVSEWDKAVNSKSKNSSSNSSSSSSSISESSPRCVHRAASSSNQTERKDDDIEMLSTFEK